MTLRANEAVAALTAAERLLLLEVQDAVLGADARLSAAVASPRADRPGAVAVAEGASAAQHAWAAAMRASLAVVRELRGPLSRLPPSTPLLPAVASAVRGAAFAAVSLAEAYLPAAEAMVEAAAALEAGDVARASSAVALARMPADRAGREVPLPAGSAAPSPTTACDPDETPRDCRARQQGEVAAARAAEEERRARDADAIRRIGRVVRDGLAAVDAATDAAAADRAAADRARLLVAGAEGDIAIARSGRRVLVADTPPPPEATPAPEPPAATPAPTPPPGVSPARAAGYLGAAAAAAVAVTALAVAVIRQRR